MIKGKILFSIIVIAIGGMISKLISIALGVNLSEFPLNFWLWIFCSNLLMVVSIVVIYVILSHEED